MAADKNILIWFQWPQEALISVSMRFLNELEILKPDVKSSIAQFMAYVHGSVNEMSKVRIPLLLKQSQRLRYLLYKFTYLG